MIETLIYAFLAGNVWSNVPTFPPKNVLQSIAENPVPTKKNYKKIPDLYQNESVALAAIDMNSQKVLLEKNFYRPQQIASLTKIMTTLIILEEHELDEVVEIDPLATQVVGAQIDLYAYEKLTVQTLIEAMLIPSANDAAVALAIFNAGSEKEFVKKMNQYAKKWDLTSAQFFNASGLDLPINDEEIGGNILSAYDVLQMTRRALRNNFVRTTVQKPFFIGTSVDENFVHRKANTNQLLGGFLNLKGVKTGYTQKAGQCLVTLGVSPSGQEILTVILGSEDRFGQTENFLSWVYDAFEWK